MNKLVLLLLVKTILNVPKTSYSSGNKTIDEAISITSPNNPLCAHGGRQSPINIKTKKLKKMPVKPFLFEKYSFDRRRIKNLKLLNTGVGVTIKGDIGDVNSMLVSGGELPGKFRFHEINFHWRSEHTIDGDRYPLEMQIVHYNSRYSNIDEALDASAMTDYDEFLNIANQSDTLDSLGPNDNFVVFSIFFDVSKQQSSLTSIVDKLNRVVKADDEADLDTVDIDLKDLASLHYYQYNGSITTPACNEGVVWIVLEKPLHITEIHLKEFRKVQNEDGNPILENFRPIQQRHDRVVMYTDVDNVDNVENVETTTTNRPNRNTNEQDNYVILMMSLIFVFIGLGILILGGLFVTQGHFNQSRRSTTLSEISERLQRAQKALEQGIDEDDDSFY